MPIFKMHTKHSPGFAHPDFSNHVCRLKKAIYSLKQASRAWFHRFSSALLAFSFRPSNDDFSIFIYSHASTRILLILYVNDIIVCSNNLSLHDCLLALLSNSFPMKDPSQLHYFLGIEARFTLLGLLLMESKYVRELLHKFDLTSVTPVMTLVASKQTFSTYDRDLLPDSLLYRQMVDTLHYVTMTRSNPFLYLAKLVSLCINHFNHTSR